jgi:ribonuclease J
MVRFGAGGATIVDHVPVGRLAADGKGLLSLGGTALKDRRRVIFNGSAVATIVIDRQGRLAAPAEFSVIGLAEPDALAAAIPVLRTAVERALDELPAGQRREDERVSDVARRAVRRVINDMFGKKPLTEIHLVRL